MNLQNLVNKGKCLKISENRYILNHYKLDSKSSSFESVGSIPTLSTKEKPQLFDFK